jgi:hypothetical protein
MNMRWSGGEAENEEIQRFGSESGWVVGDPRTRRTCPIRENGQTVHSELGSTKLSQRVSSMELNYMLVIWNGGEGSTVSDLATPHAGDRQRRGAASPLGP